jgi:hypothetical protein
MMTESRDEWIKKRAYEIWEKEGYPAGRDAAHWEQAAAERVAMEISGLGSLEAKPKAKRKPAAAKVSGNGAAVPPPAKRATPRKAAAAKV